MADNVHLTCKAVLFDMDGTLVDSTRVVELAWGWWAARHDIPVEAVLSFSHGRPTIATMEHFLPARDHTEELKEMEHYEETQLDGQKLDVEEIDLDVTCDHDALVEHALEDVGEVRGTAATPSLLGRVATALLEELSFEAEEADRNGD